MIVKEIEVKSVLSKSNLPVCEYSVNPYVGCPHACKYCYASFMKRFTNHPEPWGEFLDVKHWPEIKHPEKYRGKELFIGSVTDPYNSQEETHERTRALLLQLQGSGAKLSIATKSDLILRDLDLIKSFPDARVSWSVNTLDEEAAAVVKRIFDLCISGKGPAQIANILKADNVLIAKAYHAKQKGKPLPENPYQWHESTIAAMLERMDYCGHTVNFKSYSKSHKLKKRIPTTKEQQAIFYNTHEAIVEDAVFERVQELRANKRRPTKAERQGLFSGLVYCADCGSKLHFATCKSFNGSQDHYRCAKYKSNMGSCTAHFIREEVLKQIVWSRIFDVTALFFDDIMAFREMMYQQRSVETEKEMKRKKREVGQAQKRIAELDRIFKRIYEDDISGAISHERFLKLSAEYEAEQRELEEKVKADQQEVDTYEQNKSDFDSFAAIIRKYVGIKELTPAIVNEFIKKIIVHAPEKVDGKRVQKVDIIFNFVGEINFLSATPPKRQGA